jgi:hypothetical protein
MPVHRSFPICAFSGGDWQVKLPVARILVLGHGGVPRNAVASFCAALLMTANSLAAPPANTTPDPVLHSWFKSLKQPKTGHLCCSVSDCRVTDFWIRDGHYEVEIDGWRYAVPSEAVIHGIANPTGSAVACYTFGEFRPPPAPGVVHRRPQDVSEILCFIPPRPPS